MGIPVVNPPFTVSVRTNTTPQAPVRTASVRVTYADGTVVSFMLGSSVPPTDALFDAPDGFTGRGSGEHITMHVTADGFRTADQGFDVPREGGGCSATYVALVLLQPN
jgi:hypothetical protein